MRDREREYWSAGSARCSNQTCVPTATATLRVLPPGASGSRRGIPDGEDGDRDAAATAGANSHSGGPLLVEGTSGGEEGGGGAPTPGGVNPGGSVDGTPAEEGVRGVPVAALPPAPPPLVVAALVDGRPRFCEGRRHIHTLQNMKQLQSTAKHSKAIGTRYV